MRRLAWEDHWTCDASLESGGLSEDFTWLIDVDDTDADAIATVYRDGPGEQFKWDIGSNRSRGDFCLGSGLCDSLDEGREIIERRLDIHMRKLTAFKRKNLSEPLQWKLRPNNKPVFHHLDILDKAVDTNDGEMVQVRIRGVVDLNDPTHDVAAIVGTAIALTRRGTVDSQSPELWFWQDKFWVKAVDGLSVEYYKNKGYLFYEVEVPDAEELLSQLEC